MGRQPRLALRRPGSRSREDFIVSSSNAEAVRALDARPTWHAGCLALIGPEGSGKSHLARAWAAAEGAEVLTAQTELSDHDLSRLLGRPILFEDADQARADDLLFHLINMAGVEGGGLLLTARAPPSIWPADLPDLRSRLNALPVAELTAPDDQLLEGLLRKFFGERSIRPGDDLIAYLVRRIERSAPQARDIVRQLDEAHGVDHKPVTRALARQILEIDGETGDLFE
jgi:chromosomal replication initiation ATPase DnaA